MSHTATIDLIKTLNEFEFFGNFGEKIQKQTPLLLNDECVCWYDRRLFLYNLIKWLITTFIYNGYKFNNNQRRKKYAQLANIWKNERTNEKSSNEWVISVCI